MIVLKIVLYMFLVWFIPFLIHIIIWYYDMKKGESIEQYKRRIDNTEIAMGFIPVLNIFNIIVNFIFFIIDFIYNKIKHWRK